MLPWHDNNWQIISNATASDRLAHAWLLLGPQGLGKSDFAREISQALLCEQSAGASLRTSCGQCRSCALWNSDSHPDFINIGLEDKAKTISIEHIRDMTARIGLHRHSHQFRTVLIDPADKLTPQAANSVLKSLEEPPPGTVFLLVTSNAQQLLPTIVSRCQTLRFSVPPRTAASAWLADKKDATRNDIDTALKMSGGAPLLAKAFLTDPSAMPQDEWSRLVANTLIGKQSPTGASARIDESCYGLFLRWWTLWLDELIKASLLSSHGKSGQKISEDQELVLRHLQRCHPQLYLIKLFNQLDQIRDVVRWLAKPINQGLAQQRLWIEWHNLANKDRV